MLTIPKPSLAGTLLVFLSLLGLAPAVDAKSIFDADPGHHGLLVTDLRLKHKALFQEPEASLDGGALADTSLSLDGLVAIKVVESPTGGILAFTVEPGEYWLATATAQLRAGNAVLHFQLRIPADSLPGIRRRVAVGELVYVGRIEARSIPHLTSRGEFHYAMVYDRERELDVWKKLEGKARKSAWAEKIAAKIAALESAPAGAAAPTDSSR